MIKLKVIFILCLLLAISTLFTYYIKHSSDKEVYQYKDHLNPIVLTTNKMVNLNNVTNLKDQFKIYSRSDVDIYEKTNLDTKKDGIYKYGLMVKNEAGDNYQEIDVKVKNKLVVKEVIKEVYTKSNEAQNTTKTPTSSNNKSLSDITINQYADINELVKKLSNNNSFNQRVTIDYGRVNLTIKGTYEAYYLFEDGQSIKVNVNVI